MTKPTRYTGEKLKEAVVYQNMSLKPYLPAKELVEAVNLAIHLGRPLLLKGEPGCGKSYLAKAVAHELQLPYYEFHVKSTSRAREALYTYNHIAQLRDAQLVQSKILELEEVQRRENSQHYVNFGPIGEAFLDKRRTVLLIDEIDKADIDFPNDLLNELEEMRFRILELVGRKVDEKEIEVAANPDKRPIVFITSNNEKDLPAPFLRRCIYHQIKFPDSTRLKDILRHHLSIADDAKTDLITAAVKRFEDLRAEMLNTIGEAQKASTSELIDWFSLLNSEEKKEKEFIQQLQEMKLPFPGVLIKNPTIYERYIVESQP